VPRREDAWWQGAVSLAVVAAVMDQYCGGSLTRAALYDVSADKSKTSVRVYMSGRSSVTTPLKYCVATADGKVRVVEVLWGHVQGDLACENRGMDAARPTS
jgi:hypothetical protein